MDRSTEQALHTIDENTFYQLLDGQGIVQIDIVKFNNYFAPFVSFCASDGAFCVPYGVILRGQNDLLAAKTIHGLVDLVQDLAGGSPALRIVLPKELDQPRDAPSKNPDLVTNIHSAGAN